MPELTQEQKYQLLKNSFLFKDCSEDSLLEMANDTYLRTYKKGEIFLTGDSTIHKISIIVNDGRMKVFTTNKMAKEDFTVYVLSLGHIFNIITYFDGKKDNLSAMALEDISILHCDIDIARSWINKYPKFNLTMLGYLSDRLRMAINYNISRTFYNVELRLAKLISDNALVNKKESNLINNLSHGEIAKMIGTTRAVVNRNLQQLKKDGIIEIKYKEILIKDFEKLNAFISQAERAIEE